MSGQPGHNGAAADTPQGESAAGLFADLAREGAQILREEMALARAEMRQKLDRVGIVAFIAGIAVAMALGGMAALLAAAILGLATVMSPWLAALAVGTGSLCIGAVLGLVAGLMLRRLDIMPERTLASLREHAEWARDRLH